jgi:exoribonuclease R
MVRRTVRLRGNEASVAALGERFSQIRRELEIPESFPPEVDAAAAEAAEDAARQAWAGAERADLRDVPFVTVDPPGSTDLDQAMYLRRRGSGADGGWQVDYAIADVPAFVVPGAPVDREARRRGQTLYAPDRRTPLHPPVLSEDAASLLEGRDRPAFVWRFDLDRDGTVESVTLVRAVVRSRARLDYAGVQAAADAHPGAGLPEQPIPAQAVLLREIGERRTALEQRRGGASLPLPEQQVEATDGRYVLTLRPLLPAEDWNAQVSLMTGMAAADLMLTGRVGILRTLPAPDPGAMARFRRQATALGVPWPDTMPYAELLRSLRRDRPNELALMHEAGSLFRGAGYTPLHPDRPLPEVTTHAAVHAPYAHVTAPLRRLVDRFGLVVCHALVGGEEVPGWAREALDGLPVIMAASDGLAGQLERRCTDVVEAATLAHRVGERFPAVVVDEHKTGAKVQLLDPAVLATAQAPSGVPALGQTVQVRLEGVDLDREALRFVVE